MVHLSRIVAVAQHKYILDNACMVYEVTLVTMGNTPTKFYYLETLGQNSGINAIKNVTDRAKELGSEHEYRRVPRSFLGTAQQDVRFPSQGVARREREDLQALKVVMRV